MALASLMPVKSGSGSILLEPGVNEAKLYTWRGKEALMTHQESVGS
jgi:hypothetical protein